jgi:hypothetical protein
MRLEVLLVCHRSKRLEVLLVCYHSKRAVLQLLGEVHCRMMRASKVWVFEMPEWLSFRLAEELELKPFSRF